MSNKNIYEELKKYGVETKGADPARVLLALPEELRDRFTADSDNMEVKAKRAFVQAAFDLYNQMRSAGSDQQLDKETVLRCTRELLGK